MAAGRGRWLRPNAPLAARSPKPGPTVERILSQTRLHWQARASRPSNMPKPRIIQLSVWLTELTPAQRWALALLLVEAVLIIALVLRALFS